MELLEYHQWWKHQGGQELRRLLMEYWDPIGVKNSPEAADEYDGYHGGVMKLLRKGASGAEVAEYLSLIERDSIGFDTAAEKLQPLGDRIVAWYPDSLERWTAAHPRG